MTFLTITDAIRARRAQNSDQPVTADNMPKAGDLLDVEGDNGALVVYSGSLVRIQPDPNRSSTNTYTRDDLLSAHARYSYVEGV